MQEEEIPTCMFIGDPHFKKGEVQEGLEFIKHVTAVAQEYSPTFIVVLGDTLDKHNNSEVHPFKLAYTLIRELRKVAHVYFLIGNHDLRNNKEYFSDYHFFGPLSEFENVTLVDTEPIYVEYSGKSFVMVPYLPKGRLIEGLNTLLEKGEMWESADAVIGHQEIMGCTYGAKESTTGDIWDEMYPPLFCGHIHKGQIINNVYYPGTARQTSFGDTGKKSVWIVTFEYDEENDRPFHINYVNIGMKEKRLINMNIEELDESNITKLKKLAKKHHVKLKLTGTSEQFKIFKSRKLYREFKLLNVKFAWNHAISLIEDDEKKRIGREKASFVGVLQELVLREENSSLNHVYEKALNMKLPEEVSGDQEDQDEQDHHRDSEEISLAEDEDTSPDSEAPDESEEVLVHPVECPECGNKMIENCDSTQGCGFAECEKCDFQSDFLQELCDEGIHCDCCCDES